MLTPVSLVDQWRRIESELPEGWGDARLRLTITNEGDCDRAAALLGPVNPGRRGKHLRFFAARRGAGPGPDQIRRLLRRLDGTHIDGELELVASSEPEVVPPTARPTLAASWDAELAALPSDWTDLYSELELFSTDYLERAALLLSPANPSRYGGKPGFRFRVARRFGYGASAEMVRRCLERCDEDGIRGTIRVLWGLSDTHPVATQGPVWYVGGRAV
jgi:hypothetical protein